LRIEIRDGQVFFLNHAEEHADSTAVGLPKQVANFRNHGPSGDKQTCERSGELHCARVIGVPDVKQGEKRAGVSEDVSRRRFHEPRPSLARLYF